MRILAARTVQAYTLAIEAALGAVRTTIRVFLANKEGAWLALGLVEDGVETGGQIFVIIAAICLVVVQAVVEEFGPEFGSVQRFDWRVGEQADGQEEQAFEVRRIRSAGGEGEGKWHLAKECSESAVEHSNEENLALLTGPLLESCLL